MARTIEKKELRAPKKRIGKRLYLISVNLQSEKSIVWIKGEAEDYPFLRESAHLCHFRERFPVKSIRGRS
jgi:hypothetical protein